MEEVRSERITNSAQQNKQIKSACKDADGSGVYLYGVHGARSERCVREGLSRTQKVADAVEVVLVLFDGLDAQTVPGQHRLVTRSVAWWREELEISVAASQEKSQPERNMYPSEFYKG